jgi:hypothetical protein
MAKSSVITPIKFHKLLYNYLFIKIIHITLFEVEKEKERRREMEILKMKLHKQKGNIYFLFCFI